jgi:hypothetical protein
MLLRLRQHNDQYEASGAPKPALESEQPRHLGRRPAVSTCRGRADPRMACTVIPEAGIAFDLVEGRVEGAKLVSDTLDHGPHIRPIAIGPASGDEAHIVRQRAQARANAQWWVLNSSRRWPVA